MRSLGLIVLVFGLVAACGGSSNSGDEGTGGKTGPGASSGGAQGTASCLAQPRNGDSCSRDGVCDTNPACSCVNLVVECNGNPPRGSGGNSFGQGGRGGTQAEGGRTSTQTQGGRTGRGGDTANPGQGGFNFSLGGGSGTAVDCGTDPQTGSDCTGLGECPGVQGCFCADGGGVLCINNQGQGGADARGGASSRGGREGRGGRPMTEGGAGPIENGGSPSSGGHVTSGGTTSSDAGAPSEEPIVCPSNPSVNDPCTGPDGACPNDSACFCIGQKVQGSQCGR